MVTRTALLIALCLSIVTVAFAQPWMNEFDLEDGERPSFNEVQDAFNRYWVDKTPSKGTGFKQFKRWEWFMESHLQPNGDFDPRAFWESWEEKERVFTNSSLDEADWYTVGPYLTRAYYVGGMGRLNCVSFHPTDNNIIYVGAASGGLWRTTDHGETWEVLTDDLPLLGVSDIAIDYTDTDILYLATGDRDAGDTPSIGVLKSTNGGETWVETSLTYDIQSYSSVAKLIIHPTNPLILIAATTNGLYRTENGGDNWELVSTQTWNFKDLEVNPDDANIWFATAQNQGILKSSNGGLDWDHLGSTTGAPTTGITRTAIAISRANTNVIYAVCANSSNGFAGLWRSLDNGVSWSMMSNTPNLLGWASDGSGNGGQGWYDLAIAADPADSATVYVGGINIWKSIDGGANWQIKAHWSANNAPLVHADQHAFEFRGDTLYVCHDGGINYTTNGGTSWPDISSGLVITQIYRLGTFQGSMGFTRAMNGNQDNGSSLYNNSLWTSELGGDGMECAIDHFNPNIMYGEIYFGNMSKTVDGGQTWYPCNDGADTDGAWVTPFVQSENHFGTLFKATRQVYKSVDYAESWEPISDVLYNNAINVMAISPDDDDHIYVTRSGSSSILKATHDGGDFWVDVVGPRSNVSYMAVDPESPYTVYATINGYYEGDKVFVTNTGGGAWTNISGDLPNMPVNCIVVHPDNREHLYIGTDTGVYFSPDAGQTWQDFSQGLPNVIISELELHQNSNNLVAATYGRGMWVTPAESPVPTDVPMNPVAHLNTENGVVTFGWVVPLQGDEGLLEFIAYRDEVEIGRTTEYVITDQLIENGTYSYSVKASYEDGVSDFSVPVEVIWESSKVVEDLSGIPDKFNLLPAYPNPFNAQTTVTLALPQGDQTDVRVFNILGAEVAVLQDGPLSAGYHKMTFDASNLVSGVYFIRAKVPGKLDMNRKIVLTK